jgi:UDP-N-acetyl-D-glucosamine dehydrogenase
MRGLNYKTRFIEVAGEVNSEMPLYWVRKVAEKLNDAGKAVRGSQVLVVGVAYKKDIDDIRESPALDVIRLLHQQGAAVQYHDPHIAAVDEDGEHLHSVPLTAASVAKADCVVIVTDHSTIDYGLLAAHARCVVDTRNVLARRAR